MRFPGIGEKFLVFHFAHASLDGLGSSVPRSSSLGVAEGKRMPASDETPADSADELFSQSMAQYQLRIYSFIVTAVSRADDVEDIRQNVNFVLWKKRRKFEPGTNFLAWALQITRLEIRKFQQQHRRQGPQLSELALEMIVTETVNREQLLEDRREALLECVQTLSAADRDLLRAVYQQGQTIAAFAEQRGRSASSVRHSISRIRRQLKQCIDTAVARENRS